MELSVWEMASLCCSVRCVSFVHWESKVIRAATLLCVQRCVNGSLASALSLRFSLPHRLELASSPTLGVSLTWPSTLPPPYRSWGLRRLCSGLSLLPVLPSFSLFPPFLILCLALTSYLHSALFLCLSLSDFPSLSPLSLLLSLGMYVLD